MSPAQQKPRLRAFDFVLLFFCAAVTVFFSLRAYGSGGSPRFVLRGVHDRYLYPINNSETIVDVEGPLGVTRVALSGGQARIISSPCRNQICVASGAVGRRGQWIACLPNGVFLSVENTSNTQDIQDIDAVSW
ncbi:MAG: NusG domain II-containing protein [Treponema sp.]|jgi:hypothetical protein|nr:NusG domain II-containing protein [Treponema sp.]